MLRRMHAVYPCCCAAAPLLLRCCTPAAALQQSSSWQLLAEHALSLQVSSQPA